MSERTYNVLFLCTGNSARSIMGEALVNLWGAGRFHGFSAGSTPRGDIHPLTVKLLNEQGFETASLRSKSWNEFATPDAPVMDFVFTVCDAAAAEICPVWPGHPVTAHWGVPDPAVVEGSEVERMLAFRDAFSILERRVKLFLSLPFHKLDLLALRDELRGIGHQQAVKRD